MPIPRWALAAPLLALACGARAQAPADPLAAQVRQAALAELARQGEAAGWNAPAFDVAVAASTRPATACRDAVGVEPVDTRQSARMRFALVCAGADGWRVEFVARARVSALVMVAAVDVAAGATLALADVKAERRDISAVADSIATPAQAAGMASRRQLRAGELLRAGALAAPILVKRGEAVRIVARREQVEVTMAGEALDAGARDALVRVRNANGAILRTRVLAPGTVEPVDLAPSIQ
jgi:flagella basal body P-ring formation protein FlgA